MAFTSASPALAWILLLLSHSAVLGPKKGLCVCVCARARVRVCVCVHVSMARTEIKVICELRSKYKLPKRAEIEVQTAEQRPTVAKIDQDFDSSGPSDGEGVTLMLPGQVC